MKIAEVRALPLAIRPGLGADPNPEVRARYPYQRATARPFYLT